MQYFKTLLQIAFFVSYLAETFAWEESSRSKNRGFSRTFIGWLNEHFWLNQRATQKIIKIIYSGPFSPGTPVFATELGSTNLDPIEYIE